MNPFYAHLKLPLELDLRPLAMFDTDTTAKGHIEVDRSRLPAALIDFLHLRGMKVLHCEAFYTPPGHQMGWHADGKELTHQAKLNFAYGGEGSVMKWWALKDPNYPIKPAGNHIGKRYVAVPLQHLNQVAQAKIGQPSLVNVGQIHSMENGKTEERWCLSIVIGLISTGKAVPFLEARWILEDLVV
jgi:hypothetical protein